MIIVGLLLLFIIATILVAVFILFTEKDRKVLFSRSRKLQYEGLSRDYRVVEPPKAVTKIIIGFHGFGDTSRRFAYYTGLHNVVDDHTLVVYPEAGKATQDGIKKGWNAGFCCGSGFVGQVDDVGYIVALLSVLQDQYNAKDSKVFATGFSNGAFMAQRLASEHPEIFDAIAAVSGSIGTTKNKLEPKGPVPILLLHGEKDLIVPFGGGVGSSDSDFMWLSFQDTLTAWNKVNGTEAEVRAKTYESDGHIWHDWRIVRFWHKQPDASKEIISFFSKK